MKRPFFQVDAFTDVVFGGNPAGVCLMEAWEEDDLLRSIASENNLSETAFLVEGINGYEIRWFTPLTEVKLCGHATLASAHVLFERLGVDASVVHFQTKHCGTLTVSRRDEMLVMDFPARPPVNATAPPGLIRAFGLRPEHQFQSEEDWLLVYRSGAQIRRLEPDIQNIAEHTHRGVIVTAPDQECDFVSRFFAPKVGIPEDPVTGSAHCVLIPYWAQRLNKENLQARQVSRRGGELFCRHRGTRVEIGGKAVIYLEGSITV
jgi:PhzF family phenazine biosynthesis protein